MRCVTLYGYCRMILTLVVITQCYGYTLDNVMNLHDDLFVTSNYNRNLRGIADQSAFIRVGANFTMVSLGEVMEREEAFSVMGLLYLSWKDERLVWNASHYNGTTELVVYQEMVWKPEVKLANPMLGVYALGNERSHVRIYNTGKVDWMIPDMYTATCNINVVSFPWDRQSCSLDFIVSAFKVTEVIIEADSDHIETYEENEQWDVVKTSVVSQTDIVSKVKFWMCLERRPWFHLAVIFIPIVALSVLNVVAFFVKVDSGERISFSITLLLSITLYLSTTAGNLPSHSKGMSAIIYCLDFVLAESMFICMLSIYSQHVYHKQGAPSITCQKIVMKLLGRKCDKVTFADQSDTVKKFTADESPECETDCHVDSIEDEDLGITWMDVSLLVDRASGCLSFMGITGSFGLFASHVVNSKTECM